MTRKRRDTSQQQQERISRPQFKEFLEQHEWHTNDISTDFGEDILVQIYEQRVSTGLSFYVQLKSTNDIAKHFIKSGEIISYPFEVKDLEHWEAQAVTVILVVWDIQQKRGWWIWIDHAIQFLTKNNPEWRQKGKVNIHIPVENEFNEAGLSKLRHLLANLYYPIISKGKDLTINAKFSFPETPDGRAKLVEWQQHFATGDDVELDGKYIQALDFPDWWKRLYGEIDPSTMWVKIGAKKAEAPRPVQIEFLSETGEEKIPYVELWNVKQGEEEVTFTNEHQNIPTKFSFVFSKVAQSRMNMTINFSNLDSALAFHILKIQKLLSAKGIVMKLTFLDTGDVIPLPAPLGQVAAPDDRLLDFVEKICLIQNALGKKIIIPECDYFADKDVDAANELISIIQKGHSQESNKVFSIELLKPGIEKFLESGYKDGEPMYFQIAANESFVELFAEKIELGPVIQKIKGYWEMPLEKVQIWLEQAKESDSLTVKLVNVELFEEFEKWLKK